MIDRSKVRRYSASKRKSIVSICDSGDVPKGDSFRGFLNSMPNILAAKDFREVIGAIKLAKKKKSPIIWGFGAHVIKCGLGKYLVELMKNGFVSCLATNGASAVHDSEIALFGKTSEDVSTAIKDGSFGFCEETGRFVNNAIKNGAKKGYGYGKSIGQAIIDNKAKNMEYSIFANAVKMDIPITVHIAIGTDITHMHPECDGAAIGESSYKDFMTFCDIISKLQDGVYINVGSAVILPEVFLKALSLSRNLGHKVNDFTTVNMDFVRHYRAEENVLRRPGGKGYNLIGHHEIMIPLLANTLLKA
jgi:hypothetical protein